MKIHQILIAIDQLANTLTSDGWAGETLSAHAWRMRDKSVAWGRARKVIDAIFFWQSNHCEAAFNADVQQAYSPAAERNPNNPIQP